MNRQQAVNSLTIMPRRCPTASIWPVVLTGAVISEARPLGAASSTSTTHTSSARNMATLRLSALIMTLVSLGHVTRPAAFWSRSYVYTCFRPMATPCLRALLTAAPGAGAHRRVPFRYLTDCRANKARSSLSPAAAAPAPTIKERGKMDPFQLPEDAAASAAQASRSRPRIFSEFRGIFFRCQSRQFAASDPLTSFLRRPAGLPASQVGQGADTPRGSNTPLSAAFSRQVAATAAGPDVSDAPPPGSPPVTHEPGGCFPSPLALGI